MSPAAVGIASLSLFGAEGGAYAQTTAAEQTLPEVRVEEGPDTGFRTDSTRSATRTDTPLRDIPQFINIVPQSVMRSQNASTLQEALRNVPGISYAAPEGGTQVNQVFFLRGFPIFDNLFIDGVRDLGEYNRDVFATDSVEVLKGPSALMFGRGNPGGLINQIPKYADRLERREVALTYGSYDQKRLTADLNVRTGESSALRLVALGEDSGNFRYPQGVEKYGFAPSFWTNIGNATDITLSYYYLNERSVTDYGQPTLFINQGKGSFLGFSNVPPRTYYGFANNDFSNYQTSIATARIEHQFSNTLSLRNVTRWASYKRQMEATITEGIRPLDANGNAVTAATPLSLIQVTRNHDTNRSRDNDDDALINQTEVTWNATTGTIKHTVLGGLELGRERLDRQNNRLDASPALAGVQAPSVISPLLDPNPNDPLSYTKNPNQIAQAEGDTIAVYAQDQIQFTEQWKALVGMRYEHYKAKAQTIGLAPGVASAGPFSRTDNMLSGRAGLIWQPTRTQSYYVSWGNSYNPSGQLDVGDSPFAGAGGTTAQTNLNAINQNLEPEKNENVEVGAQWDIGGVQVRSAVFRNEKTNARQLDSTGTTTVLGGKRRVDGIEFEASGSITRNWDVFSGIVFMLRVGQHKAPARAAQGLVGGAGDEIRDTDGAWIKPGRDQAGVVRDVRHEERTDALRDRAKTLPVDHERVRRCACDDQLRLFYVRKLLHFSIVDRLGFRMESVRHCVEVAAADIDLRPVGQVATRPERHAENRITRMQSGEVDRLIRLRAGVWLHVRIARAEERLRAIDRELLGDVDEFAAAVVALSRIAFGVLVREHRALRMEHARARVVLRCDQLDVLFLASILLLDRAPDFLVIGIECVLERIHEGRRPL